MNKRVMIVEDDDQLRFGLSSYLRKSGFEVLEASNCAEAEATFRENAPRQVILDLLLPDGEGIALLGRLRRIDAGAAFFILSGHGTIDLAVRAVKEGATEFFTKPIAMTALSAALERALAENPHKASGVRRKPSSLLLGESAVMKRLGEQLERLKGADCPVLILGETGTGKSVLARHLHEGSPRAGRPFVDLNCASLSKEFLEAELFGHERGAFTGAHAAKAGLVDAAHGGTLFLDEIGDIDVAVQPKVLKVLEEKRYRRLGEVREREADVRLVAATHRDLNAAIAGGSFRSDLYYRISTVFLTVPALRDRGDDIQRLADHFLGRAENGDGRELSSEARRAIAHHPWPGNVRELRNVIERSALLSSERVLGVDDLRFDPDPTPSVRGTGPQRTLQMLEQEHIERALAAAGGRVEVAARELGLARSTLYLKIKLYGLSLSKFQTSVPKTG